jgi:uncharacterized protein YabN with tetrapyrrole methylase and pyrophosphatase domain
LALAAKLQRKAESIGMDTGSLEDRRRQIVAGLDGPAGSFFGEGARLGSTESSGETLDASAATVEALGEMLFALADAARRMGVDPESALRGVTNRFRQRIEASEASPG